MKLTVTKRPVERKSDAKKIRREGDIPAVVYASGQESESVLVNGTEFQTILRGITQGMLPTTVFEIDGLAGNKTKALVKGIQYHRTTYQILHLDFQLLQEDQPVKVKVPVECVGSAECVGIKLGGFLRQIKRTVEIECLPKDIPAKFFLDIKDLGLFATKKLKDLVLPKGVKLLGEQKDVVAVIAKR